VKDWSIYNTFMLTLDATPKGALYISQVATSKQPIENRKQVRRS